MSECVLWVGGVNSAGYGYFYRKGEQVAAHRDAWEQVNGPIPEGLTIDHVVGRGCTSKLCINPDHLEPVTRAENSRREMVHRPKITHCRRAGHLLAGDNLYVTPGGKRHCNTCRRERVAAA